MKPQSALFLMRSEPGDAAPTYLPGTVLKVSDDGIVAHFLTDELDVHAGQVLLIYFKEGRRFFRQSWRAVALKRLDEGVRLKLEPEDRVHSAENRRSERYSTVFDGMTAKFGEEEGCLILDISADGIALISAEKHELGDRVRFEMWAGETFYQGWCKVRNAIPGQRGRTRYGIECDEDDEADNLKHSLSRLWLTLQVKQLENSVPVHP